MIIALEYFSRISVTYCPLVQVRPHQTYYLQHKIVQDALLTFIVSHDHLKIMYHTISIVKNVMKINLKYNCDHFVSKKKIKSGQGGIIKSMEILILKKLYFPSLMIMIIIHVTSLTGFKLWCR
jgi:hypothetical protein